MNTKELIHVLGETAGGYGDEVSEQASDLFRSFSDDAIAKAASPRDDNSIPWLMDAGLSKKRARVVCDLMTEEK